LLSITALPLLLLLVLSAAMLAIGKRLIQEGKTTSQDVVGTYTSLYLAAEAFGLVSFLEIVCRLFLLYTISDQYSRIFLIKQTISNAA
jgi:hypothetical protein